MLRAFKGLYLYESKFYFHKLCCKIKELSEFLKWICEVKITCVTGTTYANCHERKLIENQ